MTVFQTSGDGSLSEGRALAMGSEEQIALGNSPGSA